MEMETEMTYVIHYVNMSRPSVTWTDDPDTFEADLADEASAFRVDEEKDLDKVPTPVLVALYNAGTPGDPIKKFENRAVARTRTWSVFGRIPKGDLQRSAREAIDEGKDKTPTPEPAEKGKGSPAKGKRLGIGARMRELLKAGKSTEDVLKAIHGEFPQSRAKAADVSIVRRKMKEDDE